MSPIQLLMSLEEQGKDSQLVFLSVILLMKISLFEPVASKQNRA